MAVTIDGTNGITFPNSSVQTSAPGMVLISTATASSTANIDFTGLSSTYDLYLIELVEIVGASATGFRMLTSSNNGSSYDTTGYTYQSQAYLSTSPTYVNDFESAATYLNLWNNNGGNISTTASHSGLSGVVYLYSPASSAFTKYQGLLSWFSTATTIAWGQVSGARLSTSPVNAIRLQMFSGNIASGKVRLYGFANS